MLTDIVTVEERIGGENITLTDTVLPGNTIASLSSYSLEGKGASRGGLWA